ncbi:polysaccharide deacetylase family protein [Patescibacteria group bacterium]|nr:polysaccharide deacetylase family protein [Patescibacteria group bacterium]
MKKIIKTILITTFCLFISFIGFYKFINSTKYQAAGTIINKVNTTQKIVALTFDDGPNEKTDEILNILDEKNIKATFYLIGEQIRLHPEEAKKIVAAGHDIGNHSYSHTRMVFKSPQFVAEEIEKTNSLIREASFSGEITFRPPYGKKFLSLPLFLAKNNIKTIMWTLDPLQSLQSTASAQEIAELVIKKAEPGSIVLIHPWYGDKNNSRDAIAKIIDGLQSNGYQIVTVKELLK